MLADQGLIGFVLLVLGVGLPLLASARGARQRLLPAAAAFGGGAYWLIHGSADWLWSFPAIGVPFFVLLGIGASARDEIVPLRRRFAVSGATVAAALVVLMLLPTWLAGRLVREAQLSATGAPARLRWAHRLDPLSTDVFVTRATEAPTYAAQVAALRTAVQMAPRQASLHYLLGVVELNGGHLAVARAELTRARALDPGDPVVERALALTAKR